MEASGVQCFKQNMGMVERPLGGIYEMMRMREQALGRHFKRRIPIPIPFSASIRSTNLNYLDQLFMD